MLTTKITSNVRFTPQDGEMSSTELLLLTSKMAKCHPSISDGYGDFLNWWYPTTHGFSYLKMMILGCFGDTTM